jgi:hypothetical protein
MSKDKKKNAAFFESGHGHRLKLGNIRTLLRDRWKFELPNNNEDAAADLRILLHVKASACRPDRREKGILNEISLWAPWMPPAEAKQTAAEIACKPRKMSTDDLGNALGVDSATRDRLEIWLIGAYDLSAEDRKERRRQRDRERKRRARQPRAEYLAQVTANSKRSTKPWEAMGISRRTYYYRQSKLHQVRPQSNSKNARTHPVQRMRRQSPPAMARSYAEKKTHLVQLDTKISGRTRCKEMRRGMEHPVQQTTIRKCTLFHR